MNKNYTLNSIFQNWKIGGGVLSAITTRCNVPWKDTVNAAPLDLDYHGNRSGNKFISPLLVEMLDESGELQTPELNAVCDLIFLKYGRQWLKLWKADIAEYDPVENYHMTETGSDNALNGGSKSGSHSGSRNETSSGSGTISQTASIHGFDSSSAVPADEQGGTSSTSSTNAEVTGGQMSETTSESRNATHSLTRSGNIGVTTSAQMIEGERGIWVDWAYFDEVFRDIDSVLVTAIFAERFKGNFYEITKGYQLRPATADVLGGVKADPKEDRQTVPVGIGEDGKLYYYESPGAVTSVNGKSGEVELTAEDVGAIHSVNGITGEDVVLNAESLGISEEINYTGDQANTGSAGQVWTKDPVNGDHWEDPTGGGDNPVFYDYFHRYALVNSANLLPVSVGYVLSERTTKIEITAYLAKSSTDNLLIGSIKDGYQGNFYIGCYQNKVQFGNTFSTAYTDEAHTFSVVRDDGCYIDDSKVTGIVPFPSGHFGLLYSIYGKSNGSVTLDTNRIYRLKIWEGDTLVIDQRPARIGQRHGVWDEVGRYFIDMTYGYECLNDET